ncbi:MAG: hypothetical protein OXH92_09305 [Bryobacterales bacterium]|nr:hypothetical protein [Bryobacterales bacterium]MDE0434190.1 hypothetical protein [Bryobacterales bacterium]
MNSTSRQFFLLFSLIIAPLLLGFGIGKIIVEVTDQKPRCSPDCSCIYLQETP